jgi:dTDP-4-amino-4,6-dideoxygalactose transaminase
MNDVSAAYLWGNLKKSDKINKNRFKIWKRYYSGLSNLQEKSHIILPSITTGCKHNAHMFYIKVKDLKTRTMLIENLKSNHIMSVFHYIPLHSSIAGLKFGEFYGKDKFTTTESERLIRLPIYYGLENINVDYIINTIKRLYNESK